jgi:hypothetical protein
MTQSQRLALSRTHGEGLQSRLYQPSTILSRTRHSEIYAIRAIKVPPFVSRHQISDSSTLELHASRRSNGQHAKESELYPESPAYHITSGSSKVHKNAVRKSQAPYQESNFQPVLVAEERSRLGDRGIRSYPDFRPSRFQGTSRCRALELLPVHVREDAYSSLGRTIFQRGWIARRTRGRVRLGRVTKHLRRGLSRQGQPVLKLVLASSALVTVVARLALGFHLV